jgi:hypothetical protein
MAVVEKNQVGKGFEQPARGHFAGWRQHMTASKIHARRRVLLT